MAKNKIKQKSDLQGVVVLHNEFVETDILSGSEKLVFMAIKRHLNNESETAFPSLTTIARYSRLSKSTVQRTLKDLESKGIIEIEHRKTEKNGNTSNLYTIHDYKSMWTVKNSKEIKQVIKREQEQEAIKLLESIGYTVTKEKGLETEPTKAQNQAPNKSNMYISKDNTNQTKSQELERYTMEDIKALYEYYSLIIQYPAKQTDIDVVFDILYDTLNCTKKTIRIGGEDKPVMIVIGKMMKLQQDDLIYSINKYHEQTERIKNVKGYLLTILYNSKEQQHLDIMNLGHANGDF